MRISQADLDNATVKAKGAESLVGRTEESKRTRAKDLLARGFTRDEVLSTLFQLPTEKEIDEIRKREQATALPKALSHANAAPSDLLSLKRKTMLRWLETITDD